MKISHLFRYLSLLSILTAPLCIRAQQVPPGMQTRPLYGASVQGASGADAANVSTDPRVLDLAQRLRTMAGQVRDVDLTQVPMALSEQPSVKRLHQHSAGKTGIRMRHNTGTPRFVEPGDFDPTVAARSGATRGEQEMATARHFLRENRELLRLKDPDQELALEKSTGDELGQRHLRFAQRYQNIPVWPAEVGVHLDKKGRVSLMTGAYVPTPEIALLKPSLDREEAVNRARLYVPSGDRGEASTPQLIIYAPGEQTPRLSWKLELMVSLAENWLVVVDAQDGRILDGYNQVYEAAAAGSGVDVFGQTRALNVWEQGGTYTLTDTSKKMFDPTSQPPAANTTRGGIVILDAQNLPTDNNLQNFPQVFPVTSQSPNFGIPASVSATFTVSRIYDYYLSEFNRNSFDDKGTTIPVIVRLGTNFKNAFFGNGTMSIGDGDTYAGALDVIAHEITHGVTQSTSNLKYEFQSGALNEALSDIFGEMCEFRLTGNNDWLLGTDTANPLRDLKNPGSKSINGLGPYPSKMSEFYNLDISRDKGGVHTNSSIINHCFYLLTEGLQGGIGRVDAEKIFYRANTIYLMENSQFSDARLACLRSAKDLFGDNSVQAQRTAAAYDAVEIFDTQATPPSPDIPKVDAADSTLFLYGTQTNGFFLARREASLNDPTEGHFLGSNFASVRPPAANGAGTLAAYVTADNDLALVRTDGQGEQKLGFPGTVYSVGLSPDGSRFGFVLRDANGQPDNFISVIDVATPNAQPRTYELLAPANDGGLVGTIVNADSMTFTADGRYLVYDAVNAVRLAGGAQISVYSIYSLDLANGSTNYLVPPLANFNIGNPSISKTNDDFMTFEALNQAGVSTVLTVALNSGNYTAIGSSSTFAHPTYTGADDGIVYTEANPNTVTGVSLVRQALLTDRQTASGTRTLWLQDGGLGVIYRRGVYQAPPRPSPITRLANIATRMRVLTGDRALIAGFIVTGNEPKKVIVRGLGPSISGVGGTLPDPTLKLRRDGNTVATNDNWKEHQADVEATGIPPRNDLESAIVATLDPGSYTAILEDKNGASGVGIVEVYDLAQTAGSKLANISTRGFVDTGDNVMIGGLIVTVGTDAGTAKVIVRALGPSLTGTGVQGALQDPTLELFNGNGVATASNNDWRQTQQAEIMATGIPPTDDREAAIVSTLVPGNYTAIVRGNGGTTGVGLVEVYNVP